MFGYFYKKLKYRTSNFENKYYLNFKPKINYKYLNEENLPINFYNGDWIIFPITIMNYYLGHLDNESLGKYLPDLISYFRKNINKEGNLLFKHNFNEKNWGNKSIWYSNLPHAIFFSIICRIPNSEIIKFKLDKTFIFNSLFQNEIYNNGIFIEYPSIESQPQNGQLFGLFAVFDAFNLNMINKEFLNFHLNSTFNLVSNQFTILGWTKYNNDRIASPFYHFLHINQYKVCIKYDKRFLKFYFKAILGSIFYPLILVYKIIEKLFKK